MSQSAGAMDAGRGRFMRSASEQARAFAEARSHSRRVRVLKRGIVAGAAAIVAVLAAYAVLDPFARLPAGVAIDTASLSGSRITMDAPRLSGFRKDGRPYHLRASSGVQDIRQPTIIELNNIEASFQVDETDQVRVAASLGVFDSGSDFIELRTRGGEDRIRVTGTSGYTILLQSASIDFNSGLMSSKDPVFVRLPNGTVAANAVDVRDSGKSITFSGGVRTVLQTPESREAMQDRGETERNAPPPGEH